MILIATVICIALELFSPWFTPHRNYNWFQSYGMRIHNMLGGLSVWSGPAGVLFVLLPVVVLVALLQNWLDGFALNLPLLVMSIFVLGYCLRYDPVEKTIDNCIAAHERGDDEAAVLYTKELGLELDTGTSDPVRLMADSILTQPVERLFSVIFWFVLLGPLGAVLYRLTWLIQTHPAPGWAEDQAFHHAAERLQGILDWLPVRLLAIGYALTGSFEEAIHEWRDHENTTSADIGKTNQTILRYAGYGAIHLDRFEIAVTEGEEPRLETTAIRAARGLVLRSLLAWVIVIALVSLAGWAAW